ncbi:MAG: phosphohydrolase [Clostridiales bacterium]|jgi:metal-dependent HD superfamily phosphatase/phosphodiesterase|nr:phosphohydrolase [Clostridiales bacterium]
MQKEKAAKANKTKEVKQVMLDDVRKRPEIVALITAANDYLKVRGYTEHGLRHVGFVSKTTANILRELKYDERTIELGAITGWIHDIGNAVNRLNHGITGAAMAYEILSRMHMPATEICIIISAIGNHEEQNGLPVNPVSAALILADKADAHRTRVRRESYDKNDIHYRVNYAIKKNYLSIDSEKRIIKLVIFMDESSSVMDYLQIFLSRMVLSEQAADFLDCKYELVINNTVINNHRTIIPTVLKQSETEVTVSE